MTRLTKADRAFILKILDEAQDLTLATNRPDGYPQATTVSFVHDGLAIYVGCGKDSQKRTNISRDGRVSLTVDVPYADWMQIRGLSMAADAKVAEDAADLERFETEMAEKFPQAEDFGTPEMVGQMSVLKIEPRVISILDYSKGFGHTHEVEIAPADLAE